MTACAPLLSKYELHPADRLIHHRGKRREKEEAEGRGRVEEKCPKDGEREGREGEEARWEKKDERKESGLGETSGRKRCGARLKDGSREARLCMRRERKTQNWQAKKNQTKKKPPQTIVTFYIIAIAAFRQLFFLFFCVRVSFALLFSARELITEPVAFHVTLKINPLGLSSDLKVVSLVLTPCFFFVFCLLLVTKISIE